MSTAQHDDRTPTGALVVYVCGGLLFLILLCLMYLFPQFPAAVCRGANALIERTIDAEEAPPVQEVRTRPARPAPEGRAVPGVPREAEVER